MDLTKYRQGSAEQSRLGDLMRLLPKGRKTALDIGARDGYVSRLLTEHFQSVTALDLIQPSFVIERVDNVQGDVTALKFADNSFDTVFCAEVLEHIPPHLLAKACAEITRVARHDVVIGVPYRQDLRMGRMVCQSCGASNPPWAHLNSFDERLLGVLFGSMELVTKSFVGTSGGRTNGVSSWLMAMAGDPWGTYNQEEPCIACGQRLRAPQIGAAKRLAASAGYHFAVLLNRFRKPGPMWIHMVFRKHN